MSQTYSTVNRDIGAGGVYSTRVPVRPTAPPAPRTAPRVPVGTQPQAAPQSPAPVRYEFALTHSGLPSANRLAQGVQGSLVLEGRRGENYRVEAILRGLPPGRDPAVQPTLWLLHDLTVPLDLDPADMAALPKGSAGSGNQPGQPFTVDGEAPTQVGVGSNTLSLAISPGRFAPDADGTWRLATAIHPGLNQTFHPLFYAGPEHLTTINEGVESGRTARLLTDLFMRPTSVHPELPLRTRFLDRLRTVAGGYLGGQGAGEVLDGSAFTKAAVTMEGVVRAIPALMPTREACLLLGSRTDG